MKKSSRVAMLAITITYCISVLLLFCFRHGGNYVFFRPDRLALIPSAKTGHSIAEAFDANKGKININTATAEELSMLPGIGTTIANAVVAFRESNGRFNKPTDLLMVKGIGNNKLEQILNYITTGG